MAHPISPLAWQNAAILRLVRYRFPAPSLEAIPRVDGGFSRRRIKLLENLSLASLLSPIDSRRPLRCPVQRAIMSPWRVVP